MVVEIFKTNVEKKTETNYVIAVIKRQFPSYKVNFDLEDCDNILRVDSELDVATLLLNNNVFDCIELE